MRASLLIVALACMVAMVSAQTYTNTLKGNFYSSVTDCSGTSTNSISLTYSSSSAASYPCSSTGTGSTAWAFTGYCNTLVLNYWQFYAYPGYVCSSSGSGTPTGGTSQYGYATGSDFSTCKSLTFLTTGSFQPTGCSSASTLIVPSFLLVALAFAASKLQL